MIRQEGENWVFYTRLGRYKTLAEAEAQQLLVEPSEAVLTFSEGGLLEFADPPAEQGFVEVPALLFRTGTHKGRTYVEKDLEAVVSAFRPPAGERDWEVPVQADHSDSALHTLGHVRSLSHNGQELQGVLRFVGQDAVARVRDGRFRKLSVGLRLAPNLSLREVSVTPFPHLRDAKMFKEEQPMADQVTTEAAPAAPAPADPAPASSPAPVVQAEQALAEMREQFEARTKALEDRLATQDKLLRFKERSDLVVTYMEAGKTVPAMKSQELALLETFSDEQLQLYQELKTAQPALVHYQTFGEQFAQRPGQDAGMTPEHEAQAKDLADRYGPKKKTK